LLPSSAKAVLSISAEAHRIAMRSGLTRYVPCFDMVEYLLGFLRFSLRRSHLSSHLGSHLILSKAHTKPVLLVWMRIQPIHWCN
jgi:hypothetical protein